MILVLLGICIVIFIIGCLVACYIDEEIGCCFLIAPSVVGFIVCLIATIILGVEIAFISAYNGRWLNG